MQRPRTGEIAVRNYPNEQELREFLLRHGGTWRPVPKSTPSFVCHVSGRNRIATDYPPITWPDGPERHTGYALVVLTP